LGSSKVLWDTVAIVGVGLIGGSLGQALRERKLVRQIVGIGRRRSSLRLAKSRGAVDRTSLSVRTGVTEADLVVVCTPVQMIAEQVLEACTFAPPHAVVTDTGSTKREIVATVERHGGGRLRFVGAHPLAGSERAGPEHARADLFEGRLCVLTPTGRTESEALRAVQRLWRSVGARTCVLDPEQHDRLLAYTSHAPHVIAIALMRGLAEEAEPFVASGFLDTTRIAAGLPDLWVPIVAQNRDAILGAVDRFLKELDQLRDAISHYDVAQLRRIWSEAAQRRARLGRVSNQQGRRKQQPPDA
jgi:prephenate dehydrogenase